jgi:hypothetical protein
MGDVRYGHDKWISEVTWQEIRLTDKITDSREVDAVGLGTQYKQITPVNHCVKSRDSSAISCFIGVIEGFMTNDQQ